MLDLIDLYGLKYRSCTVTEYLTKEALSPEYWRNTLLA